MAAPPSSPLPPGGAPNGVLAFFIMHCEGSNRERPVRSLFQDEIVKPHPGSRPISLEDSQTVVRDLVVNQELFDAMLRPVDRPGQGMLPPGRSFRCIRGATFSLHQFCSGTGVRFFLMADPQYSSQEAQRKLAAVYSGPWLDLVARSQSISLRDLLQQPVQLSATSPFDAATQQQPGADASVPPAIKQMMMSNGEGGAVEDGGAAGATATATAARGEKHMLPLLPPALHAALRTEIHAILRFG